MEMRRFLSSKVIHIFHWVLVTCWWCDRLHQSHRVINNRRSEEVQADDNFIPQGLDCIFRGLLLKCTIETIRQSSFTRRWLGFYTTMMLYLVVVYGGHLVPMLSWTTSGARDASCWLGWLGILPRRVRDQWWLSGTFGTTVLCAETIGVSDREGACLGIACWQAIFGGEDCNSPN